VRELEAASIVRVIKIATEDNMADVLTKYIVYASFKKHVTHLMNVPASYWASREV
jgi:hypothetical protein